MSRFKRLDVQILTLSAGRDLREGKKIVLESNREQKAFTGEINSRVCYSVYWPRPSYWRDRFEICTILFCRVHATESPCRAEGGVAEESGSVTLSHSYDEDVSDGGPVPPGLDLPLLVLVVSDSFLLRRVDFLEEVAEAESLAAEDFGVANGGELGLTSSFIMSITALKTGTGKLCSRATISSTG